MSLCNEKEKAIEKLYKEMYAALYKYAMGALNNRQLAEDAVQDSFRTACAKVDSVLNSQNPKGWLMNTLKYVIRSIRRTQAKLNTMVVSALSFEELPVVLEETEEVFTLLYSELLGENDFRLLKLLALEKYTILETAQEFGISIEACKKRAQRARKKLMNVLERADESMPPK